MDKTPLVIKFTGKEKYQRLLSPEAQTNGLKSGLVNLKPGEEIGEHSTNEREEAIIILNGKAIIYYTDGNHFDAEADSIVYMPPNTRHNIKNVGEVILSYIFVVTPVKML